MDNKFFINNRKKLYEKIKDNSIIILFSGTAPYRSADQKYKFTPNRNFYYLTGLDRENFTLIISKKNNQYFEEIFIEKNDPILEKWIGKKMGVEEVKEKSGIAKVSYIDNFNERLNKILLVDYYEYLYLDLEKREYTTDTLAISYSKSISSNYPYLKIENIYYLLSNLRMIKYDDEIENIKKAINYTKEGIKALMENSKPGLYEYQLESYFDFTIKNLGCMEKSFKTIAASGKNATILHYEDNNNVINDNELILFDLGCEYEYYCSDISRTFPSNGKFSDRQKEIYNIVLKAEMETIKYVKPGLTLKQLNEFTKKILIEECKKIGLIKEDNEINKYYYHSVSHFLGLDTHDVGDYNRKLEPGMVITIEPGLYIEEEKIGIRIEDDILITKDGCINLSEDIIRTVDEIEAFMKR